MRSNFVLAVVGLAILCLTSAFAMSPASIGLDISNPAYSGLFDEQVATIVKTNFDYFYENYYEKKGTLVVDARDFKESLTCVPGSYNVPARVFSKHASIFPATRNYFVYGSNSEATFVAGELAKRGATTIWVIDVTDFNREWKWTPQVKDFPYYVPISVDEMYGRYVDGDPQDRNPILVDVRSPAEYAMKHIKYAVNVPFEKLKENFDVLPVTQKVYLYGMDNETGIAAAKVFASEYRAYTMPIVGGLEAWVSKGYPTASGNKVATSSKSKNFDALVASLGL